MRLGRYTLSSGIIVSFTADSKDSIGGGTIEAALELFWSERLPLSSTIVLQQQGLWL